MSKAFVNEDAAAEEVMTIPRELVSPSENYLTRQGWDRYQSELHSLQIERKGLEPESTLGTEDLRRREIDLRLGYLQNLIDSVQVIDPEAQTSDRVLFGATVRVSDEEGQSHTYRIVGVHEADAKEGKVSWISPIGKALLQGRVGDAVILRLPQGEQELIIEEITYVPVV